MKEYMAKFGLAGLLFIAAGAQAASINYGDFDGSTVMYAQVTETPSPGTNALYGAPTISGNTLDFDPSGFAATSSGGGAPSITDGQLQFDIYAHSGAVVQNLQFAEGGDFTLSGIGTDATFVDVSANFFVDIYEVDGVAIDEVSYSLAMTFSPNADGTFQLVTDGGGGPVYNGIWDGSVDIDLLGILDDNSIGYLFGVTKLSVSLDNTLVAGSEANTSSEIRKKEFEGFSITAEGIPEPSSILLMGTSVFGLLIIKRRLSM